LREHREFAFVEKCQHIVFKFFPFFCGFLLSRSALSGKGEEVLFGAW